MNHIRLMLDQTKGVINPNIYGHFTEHIGGVMYDGLWVGEDSVIPNVHGFRKKLVDSFKKINPPIIRWPGGCFAETYDWRDGIGPREKRPTRVNWWYSHDQRVESNQVGTHEFMKFCELVGAEAYFAANMTSLTPLHIRNWIEYCNYSADLTTLATERAANGDVKPFGIQYWGIGNENWGGGGQMTPEMCAREFVKYSAVCNSLDKGNLRFIACGSNGHDVDWTRRLMKEWAKHKIHESPLYGVSLHYYCGSAGNPVAFSEEEWYQLLHQADFMQAVLDDNRVAMDEVDPDRKVKIIVDEWGCWHPDGSGPSLGCNLFEQQSTMRDAVVAAMTLNMFNNRCDTIAMANVAQLCNNLHSLYLAREEDFIETPNYFVFDMFKTHMGGKQICVEIDCTQHYHKIFKPLKTLSVSASQSTDGTLTITIANLNYTSPEKVDLSCIRGTIAGGAEITVLSHSDPHAHNSFKNPKMVKPATYRAYFADNNAFEIPAASVMLIRIMGK